MTSLLVYSYVVRILYRRLCEYNFERTTYDEILSVNASTEENKNMLASLTLSWGTRLQSHQPRRKIEETTKLKSAIDERFFNLCSSLRIFQLHHGIIILYFARNCLFDMTRISFITTYESTTSERIENDELTTKILKFKYFKFELPGVTTASLVSSI